MGCCVSTPYSSSSKTPKKVVKFPKSTPRNTSIKKSPHSTHPVHEEETVKEVLSESRIVPKGHSGRAYGVNRQSESPLVTIAPLLSANASTDRPNGVVCRKPYMSFGGDKNVCEGMSSEEKGGVSGVQLQKMSPGRRRGTAFTGEVNRERTVGSFPGQRPQPSSGGARSGNWTGFEYGRRRNTWDSPRRRSKSPAGQGRCPSPRKPGESPCRVGSDFVERVRKLEEEGKDRGDRRRPPTSNESLENPLVSLECFIFL